MSKAPFQYRLSGFIIGLVVGAVLGCLAVLFLVPDPEPKVITQVKTVTEKAERAPEVETTPPAPEQKPKTPARPVAATSLTSVVTPASEEPVELPVRDTLPLALNDSLMDSINVTDSTVAEIPLTTTDSQPTITAADTFPAGPEDELPIVVRKEQMVAAFRMPLVILGEPKQQPETDSVLAELSGIVETRPSDTLMVEFWQSPVNYKGYKMANNKMVLFGLRPEQNITRIYRLDQKIYLKHAESYFAIDHTFAFKPFRPLADETLIGRLRP